MNEFQKEQDVAIAIAKEAGKIMLEYFDADQQVETKADNTFVTVADKKINSLVIQRLEAAFPKDGIIGEEESNAEYGMGRRWVCDPIDGTHAFIYGLPSAMFSLGLVVDGVPILGVAYDPFLDKLYTGVKGGKSYCNQKEISVSNLDLESGTLAVTSSVQSWAKKPHIQKLIDDKIRMASFSGAVLKSCLVARGKFTGYLEAGINPHDLAAAHVIVECAGGKVTAMDGSALDYSKPFKGAIISNSVVHDKLVEYCK
ncbi:MAG: inositol monophosphatase [Patescibacteria group bacterium]